MDVGRLRHRITIRREENVSDGKGGYDRAWTTLADRIAADVTSLNGREAVLGNVLQGISVFQITTRFRTNIQPSDQIIWHSADDRELNVHNAEDKLGTKQWTVIQASTEAPQSVA